MRNMSLPCQVYRVIRSALLLNRAWLTLLYFIAAIMHAHCSSSASRLCLMNSFSALASVTGILAGVYVVMVIESLGSLTVSIIGGNYRSSRQMWASVWAFSV
jgi:hypothetical protein